MSKHPLVVWVPYSYVITTKHRKHVIFKQVLQGYKALGNSRQFLSHDIYNGVVQRGNTTGTTIGKHNRETKQETTEKNEK
jgi:hypothetical protein